MATVASPPVALPDARVTLPHVDWDTYERLLADDEERRVPRLSFDRGMLEIMTPSTGHEEDALTIALLVEIVAAAWSIPIRSVGSMTFRREDLQQGFEPDASFYVQNERRVRGRPQIDLAIDPPPDLVLELEVSRSAIDTLALFAGMGVPEVWRCDRRMVVIQTLERDVYRESATSLALAPLTSDVITRFLVESRSLLRPDWFQAVGDWARAQRTPDASLR